MYKVNNNLAPTFMRVIFPQRNLTNMECVASSIRNQIDFYNPSNPKSSNWGLETLSHLGPILKHLSKNGNPKIALQIMQSLS